MWKSGRIMNNLQSDPGDKVFIAFIPYTLTRLVERDVSTSSVPSCKQTTMHLPSLCIVFPSHMHAG
jgi:hypothetical protein